MSYIAVIIIIDHIIEHIISDNFKCCIVSEKVKLSIAIKSQG